MFYRLAYSIGLYPWEDSARNQGFAQKISMLFDREESGREPPYGQALDLGCGSGIWGVELARRGWQVTGIDIVAKALSRASERAKNASVKMRLVHGNATALRQAGVGCGFQLVLDTGAFHALNSSQRRVMGLEVSAIAAPDASVLLLLWPQRRSSSIEDTFRREVEASFPGWKLTDVEPSGFRLPRILELLVPPGEHCYWCRLHRAGQ
jgi:SAM-dependent methyltransferase